MVDRLVERILNRTVGPPLAVDPEAAAFHASLPVVDLLVGTALFQRDFLGARRGGHVDLPRARAGGLDLVGFSIATRFPDLAGRLSTPHFAALGIPVRGRTDIQLAEAFVRRIEGWAAGSGGGLVLARTQESFGSVGHDGALRAFIGVQGGQVLGGDLRNVAGLRRLGVRMLGLAHVMDSDVAGSGSGRHAGGVTGFGWEAIAELERQDILIDLAHASSATIREAAPLLRPPFLVSHTGFRALAGEPSSWRRYSAATRNLSDADARLVAEAGGLIGVTLAVPLVGGPSMASVVRAFEHAVELAGPEHVALGSDFDGALPMPFDVTGLPALTAALLAAGFGREIVAGILGGNALRVLRS
ncbi:MAG: dipeptidase [Candidatus Limnocylindrales bacterium]